MPKDYKHTRRRRSPEKKSSKWRWFFSGLILGITVSAAGLLLGRMPDIFSIATGKQDAPRPSPTAAETPPADNERKKPHFDFYTMLPEMEVAVPEGEIEEARPSADEEPQPLRGTYVLQVGSFRKHGDAERLQASLALLGLEAHVQTVSINGEETWHRVRLGPFSETSRFNEARGRLYENQIDARVWKLRN